MRSAFTYISYYSLVGMIVLACLFSSCRFQTPDDDMAELKIRAYIQQEKTLLRAAGDYVKIDEANQAPFNAALIISSSDGSISSTAPMSWDGSTLSTNVRMEQGLYYFFGYMPWNDNASFDVSEHKLNIPDIPALGLSNAMLIKACKKNIESGENSIPLEMDHLMAKVTPYFYIDPEYNAFRDIKIKKVTLNIPASSGHLYTAVVDYDVASTPSTYGTVWNEGAAKAFTVSRSVASASEALLLPENKNEAVSLGEFYICPQQNIDELSMTVTYDVYDEKGHITRADATATNAILQNVSGSNHLERANHYKLYILVIPSYLYVLSDYDEDEVLVID
ncbi:MAG: fimbrillin family protein [Bacteroidales bacterium]|nr:fimbrillin family protein [Bacteroidales bacterium]